MVRTATVLALLLVSSAAYPGEEPQVTFEVTDAEGLSGDEVTVSVLITSDTDLQGWSWGLAFDGAALSLLEAKNGPVLAIAKNGAPADFQEILGNPPDGPGVTQGVVVDILAQILLPAGADYQVAILKFALTAEPMEEPVETEIVFTDTMGEPDIQTTAVIGGFAITPVKIPGTITILPPPEDCRVVGFACASDPDNVFLTWGYLACDSPRPFEFLSLYRKRHDEAEWTRLQVWDIVDLIDLPTGYDDLGLAPGIYKYVLAWVYWPASGAPIAIDSAECTAEVVAILITDISLDKAFLPGVVRNTLGALVPGEMVITGRGFTTIEDTTVTIGDKPVQITEITGDSVMRGIIPCSSALGTFDFKLVNSRGQIEIPDQFTYGWLRGDVRINGVTDLQDALDILGYLFNIPGSVKPVCFDAADLNDDGYLDITDAIFMVYFLSGVDVMLYTPPEPFKAPLVADPTQDKLTCALAGYDCENP